MSHDAFKEQLTPCLSDGDMFGFQLIHLLAAYTHVVSNLSPSFTP